MTIIELITGFALKNPWQFLAAYSFFIITLTHIIGCLLALLFKTLFKKKTKTNTNSQQGFESKPNLVSPSFPADIHDTSDPFFFVNRKVGDEKYVEIKCKEVKQK